MRDKAYLINLENSRQLSQFGGYSLRNPDKIERRDERIQSLVVLKYHIESSVIGYIYIFFKRRVNVFRAWGVASATRQKINNPMCIIMLLEIFRNFSFI